MFTPPAPSREGSAWSPGWTGYGIDGTTAMLLDQVEPAGTAFDRLERVGAWEKVIAWAQARQCVEITRFVADAVAAPTHGMTVEQAAESAQAEVGLMLTLTPGGPADEWFRRRAGDPVDDVPVDPFRGRR